MKASDLKKVVIPQVGIRYSATEKNVQVYGSLYGVESMGYYSIKKQTKANLYKP